jgi:septum site-determining protein MinD
MTRIISICSGKGGVGKTTVAVNLAAALQKLNKRTIVVDFNLTTAHIGLMFESYSGKTLNNFLHGEHIADAVHVHQSGLHMIPATLELNDLSEIKTENIRERLREALRHYDFVILDSAPGVGREALIALRACDEAIFVANPFIPSVVDVLKTKDLSSKMGFFNAGIIVNRIKGRQYELQNRDIQNFTELHVIGTVPEDEVILKSVNERHIPLLAYPKSPSSQAFMEIAHKIAGLPYGRW